MPWLGPTFPTQMTSKSHKLGSGLSVLLALAKITLIKEVWEQPAALDYSLPTGKKTETEHPKRHTTALQKLRSPENMLWSDSKSQACKAPGRSMEQDGVQQ